MRASNQALRGKIEGGRIMKKSLAAIAILLLLIFVMGGVLAACTTETVPADNSDVSEPQEEVSAPSASEVLSQAAAAIPSGSALSFEWEASANVGGDEYTDWEIAYGRDNLRTPSPEFVQKLRKEQRELRKLLEDAALSRESREEVRGRLYRLEAITDAIEGDL